uniref:Polymeric immunoglobulin receptor n=1 Tax=Pyxicephalus adspersus TaxID=30357 RepID=A0AAV2ZMZ5_PYXAD|nr:TPA: hypothetical protein GDO54_003196 [Pyxicephalus adspersus]
MNTAVFFWGLVCILLLPGAESSEIACSRHVTGEKNEKVTIKCYYSTIPAANKYDRKFCCWQGARPGRCEYTVISTDDYTANRFLNRIDIDDNRNEGIFIITIKSLEKEDEGTYLCGIGRSNNVFKSPVSLSVVEDSPIPKDAELLYIELRSLVILKCTNNEKSSSERKFLCKVTENGCKDIIDSTGKVDPSYEGRILVDKQEAGAFIVKLVEVRAEDAGFYTCGSDNQEESAGLPTYDVRINEETDIPQGPQLLTPRLGGSLTAQCNYNPKKNYTEKFWCKLEKGACKQIITSDGYVMDMYEGRVLLHDDPTSGSMQILMGNTSKEDEGWYWCVMTDKKHDQTFAIEVKLSEAENPPGLSGSKIVKATVGDAVKLSCSYPCRFKKYEKYWCKWNNHRCEPLSNVEDTQDTRLISCQTEKFLLNIKSVSLNDSGFYWCGVKHETRYDQTITVRLIVEGELCSKESPKSKNYMTINTNWVDRTGNNKSGTVTAVVVSVCAAVLVVCAVLLFIRLRKRKNSDLVSVGSYRTNISLSDLDKHIGKDNPVVTDLQETDISRSGENLDYSCILINHVGTPNEQMAE